MDDAYGIFTTDGETVAGTLNDEYALRLAERLDESTASLYISTKNGILLLGTAVNVQKKGRRPDTFIYLEKVGWTREIPPKIDLAFIHAFYGRIERRLTGIEYEVRDLASDADFFDERHKKVVTGLLSPYTVNYSVGRLLVGKEVVCVSENLSKSVDFVVAVTERLHSFFSAGFTIVVAKRFFRDADLLVTEKHAGLVHIDLDREQTNDPKWSDFYTSIGVFALNSITRQKFSGELSRKKLGKDLVSEYTTRKVAPGSGERFRAFLSEEKIGVFEKPEATFSSSAYDSSVKEGMKQPKESDYGKWEITEYDREGLKHEYADYMDAKRKRRMRLLTVLGVFFILFVAVVFLFGYPGVLNAGLNTTEIPHITPSATIEPNDASRIVTRLNTPPGNIPDNLSGFGSAYEITLSEPQNVTLNLNMDYHPDISYYLLFYNQSGSLWESVETGNSFVFTNESVVTAFIPDSGIYRFFTDRESVFHEN